MRSCFSFSICKANDCQLSFGEWRTTGKATWGFAAFTQVPKLAGSTQDYGANPVGTKVCSTELTAAMGGWLVPSLLMPACLTLLELQPHNCTGEDPKSLSSSHCCLAFPNSSRASSHNKPGANKWRGNVLLPRGRLVLVHAALPLTASSLLPLCPWLWKTCNHCTVLSCRSQHSPIYIWWGYAHLYYLFFLAYKVYSKAASSLKKVHRISIWG